MHFSSLYWGYGQSKAEEGRRSQELNLIPTVPQQNLTTEDIQQMALSIEVLMFAD